MRHARLGVRGQQCLADFRSAVPLAKPSFLLEMAVLI